MANSAADIPEDFRFEYSLMLKPERKRCSAEDRFTQIMRALIGLSIGDIDHDSLDCRHYLRVTHAAVAQACGISVSTLFQYLPTAERLNQRLIDWAEWAYHHGNRDSKHAAKILLMQYLSAHPCESMRLGLTLQLRKV